MAAIKEEVVVFCRKKLAGVNAKVKTHTADVQKIVESITDESLLKQIALDKEKYEENVAMYKAQAEEQRIDFEEKLKAVEEYYEKINGILDKVTEVVVKVSVAVVNAAVTML